MTQVNGIINTEYLNDNTEVSKSNVEKVAVKEEEIYEYEEDWQYTSENRYEDLKNEVSSYEVGVNSRIIDQNP